MTPSGPASRSSSGDRWVPLNILGATPTTQPPGYGRRCQPHPSGWPGAIRCSPYGPADTWSPAGETETAQQASRRMPPPTTVTGSWTRLPDAPVGFEGNGTAPDIWTGASVITVEDAVPGGRPLSLDLTTRRWSLGPKAPVPGRQEAREFWTGVGPARLGRRGSRRQLLLQGGQDRIQLHAVGPRRSPLPVTPPRTPQTHRPQPCATPSRQSSRQQNSQSACSATHKPTDSVDIHTRRSGSAGSRAPRDRPWTQLKRASPPFLDGRRIRLARS